MSETKSRGEAERGRLEAFSDGVFAIAVTLLILEVKVGDEGGSLAQRLRHAWPTYVAYLISFAVIGIMWINHHNMLQAVHSVDHTILVANLAMLLVISFIPFPTKIVGEHISQGTFDDKRTSVLLFGGTMVAASLVFPWLWWALTRRPELRQPQVTEAMVRAGMRRNLLGLPTYSTATLVAVWFPVVSLAVFGALAVFYLLPDRT